MKNLGEDVLATVMFAGAASCSFAAGMVYTTTGDMVMTVGGLFIGTGVSYGVHKAL